MTGVLVKETIRAGARKPEPFLIPSRCLGIGTCPGGYDPAAHLAENLEDGIYGSVLYPTEGLLLFGVSELELLHEICRAYNDWLAEFCEHDHARLKDIAMIPIDDPEFALEDTSPVTRRR